MIVQRRPDVERFLAGPPTACRAAVIHGPNLGVVRERAQALAAIVTARPDDPFDVALLTESDILGEEGRLEGELMAVSMMGGRRLVRLRLLGDKDAADKLAAEALVGHLAGQFNPDAFLLIECGPLGKGSPLRKCAEPAPGAAAIACYDDEPGDLARLTREALAADRVGLSADALELFVSRLPHERGVARREIERLILFLGPGGNRAASAADLADFLGVEPEASLSDAAVDAFGGRHTAAHASLRRAAQEGEGGIPAIRALGSHLARLRRIGVLHASGAGLQAAAKAAGVFWKHEREFLRQAQTWNLAELATVQGEILTADRACKQTGSPDRLLAERLALRISLRARRLGL